MCLTFLTESSKVDIYREGKKIFGENKETVTWSLEEKLKQEKEENNREEYCSELVEKKIEDVFCHSNSGGFINIFQGGY